MYYLVKSIVSNPSDPSAETKIPTMTGFLVAAFPLGQMSTSMIWGRLSDSYGRKPVILFGLTISVISNLAFGFSRNFGMLMFWRVLSGMVNGNTGVMRSMTAEIVKEKKYQTRAFLVLPLIFNSGRVAALAIGGCLADPVHNLPWLFGAEGWLNVSGSPGGVAWMQRYPYALPPLFNGTVLALVLLLATLFLRESLPAKENRWDPGIAIGRWIGHVMKQCIFWRANSDYTLVQIEESDIVTDNAPTPPNGRSSSATSPSETTSLRTKRPPFRKIWTPHLLITLVSFGLLPLHNSTFIHIFPVYLSMPTSPNPNPTLLSFTGGLGLASPSIGLYLATFGVCGILLQLFIFPRVQQRIGTLGCLRLASCIFPLTYLCAPYLSLLSGHPIAKWPAMGLVLFSQVMARTTATPSNVVLLNEAAPTRNVLGTVHGAGNTVSAMASGAGPVIGGIMLAWGMKLGVVGIVWWLWLFLISLLALGWTFVMRTREESDRRAEPREKV